MNGLSIAKWHSQINASNCTIFSYMVFDACIKAPSIPSPTGHSYEAQVRRADISYIAKLPILVIGNHGVI